MKRMAWAAASRALLVLAMLLAAPAGWAHKASDAFLAVSPDGQGTQLQLSLALKDIDAAVDTLDADGDRVLHWDEVRAALPAIVRWAATGIELRCDAQARVPAWALQSLEERSDGTYLRLGARVACDSSKPLALDYRLLDGIDPTHRLIVRGSWGGEPVAAVVAPHLRSDLVLGDGAAQGAGLQTLWRFFGEGVHHILTGYDHLAFLLTLLLPIMLRAQPGRGANGVQRPGLGALVLAVTGFTVGHSATLVFASLGWITASPAWVEPAIALSIAVSAALNLLPARRIRAEVLAVGFGLVHGLGFSGVMAEAGVQGPMLAWALAGFNLGVEAGQLGCVLAWCALHLALAQWRRYEMVVVRGGSVALLLLALFWTVQRLAT